MGNVAGSAAGRRPRQEAGMAYYARYGISPRPRNLSPAVHIEI